MKKILITIVIVVFIVAVGYVVYMSKPSGSVIEDKTEFVPVKAAPINVSEEDKLKTLNQLAGTSTAASDASVAEKKALLEKLSAPSQGTSTKPGSSQPQQTGPSEEEKLRILNSLGQ